MLVGVLSVLPGDNPHCRAGTRGVLYLLWLDTEGKQQKRSLKHRDRKGGRQEVLELATALAGASGRGLVLAPKPEPEDEKAPEKPAAPLTIGEGVGRAFDPIAGALPRPDPAREAGEEVGGAGGGDPVEAAHVGRADPREHALSRALAGAGEQARRGRPLRRVHVRGAVRRGELAPRRGADLRHGGAPPAGLESEGEGRMASRDGTPGAGEAAPPRRGRGGGDLRRASPG